WVPAPSTPVCSLIPAFRNKIAWNRSARFRVFPFSWPTTLPLLSAPWHGAAVHTPLRSPTAGAVTPPASVPPRPPLASSHSFLRARRWREKWAHGEVVVVRYADDIILGFQHQADADRFLENLKERLGMFGLELHPDKTRRIEFGRFAEENRRRRGEGKPETFDFLGFTHISGKNRLGRFTVRRKTIRKRMGAKLRDIKQQLRERMHDPVRQTGQWLKSIVQGHFNYYAVPGNLDSLGAFR